MCLTLSNSRSRTRVDLLNLIIPLNGDPTALLSLKQRLNTRNAVYRGRTASIRGMFEVIVQ